MVDLSVTALGQTSRFSLQLLVLLVIQLIGPVLVSVLAMALLMPPWLICAKPFRAPRPSPARSTKSPRPQLRCCATL